jgi:hypothetical protein
MNGPTSALTADVTSEHTTLTSASGRRHGCRGVPKRAPIRGDGTECRGKILPRDLPPLIPHPLLSIPPPRLPSLRLPIICVRASASACRLSAAASSARRRAARSSRAAAAASSSASRSRSTRAAPHASSSRRRTASRASRSDSARCTAAAPPRSSSSACPAAAQGGRVSGASADCPPRPPTHARTHTHAHVLTRRGPRYTPARPSPRCKRQSEARVPSRPR